MTDFASVEARLAAALRDTVLSAALGVVHGATDCVRLQRFTVAGDAFVEAARRCATAERVVFIGVGKSGFIAAKLAASFRSLGMQAIYLHAGDVVHGDVGAVTRRDVVVAISHSGTTDEVLRCCAQWARLGAFQLALCGDVGSPLAHMCDAALVTGVFDNPRLPAPMNTTTCALVVGDALAAAAAAVRGFTVTDFKAGHPGGALGGKL